MFPCISIQSRVLFQSRLYRMFACEMCICKLDFSLYITRFYQICSHGSQMGPPDNVGKTISAEDEPTYCGGPGKGETSICNGGENKDDIRCIEPTEQSK